MTKRAKMIIGVLILFLLGAGVAAGLLTNKGTNPSQSSSQIKKEIEDAFAGKEYFDSVEVKTYSGMSEEADPEAKADSAGIEINVSKIDSATFTEIATLIPETKMTVFYSVGDTADIENITKITGFQNSDLKDGAKVASIANSLKVQDEYKGSFWQISPGNAEGDNAGKMKTQFVAKDTQVAPIRATVNKVLSPSMDVLPVMKSELSQGSFFQFAAVDGKMDNYDKGLAIGLKFADATFLGGEEVVMLGLGDNIQVSYNALRKGLTSDKLTEVAKGLNKEQVFKIDIVTPEEVAEAEEKAATPEGTEPLDSSETAKPTESASPATESSAPAESDKK